MENLLSKIFIALSAVGIIDGAYTAYEYITARFTCSSTGVLCCSCVANSGHTSILGVPFWVAGITWFPLLLILGLYFTKGGTWRLRGDILLPLLMIGNLFTIYLWYLEFDVIGAFCPYCISLYIVNYALTGLVILDLIS
ncbi:MAG TPA: vitamin K epoxide reductase family protein [Nitrososphaerales archaeon]|nr:vitamin K epoxide reductase family protein [Nitrososphaerales archaeon]